MWNKIYEKLQWMIAYSLLPITLPIHIYKMRKLDKKVKKEMQQRKKFDTLK